MLGYCRKFGSYRRVNTIKKNINPDPPLALRLVAFKLSTMTHSKKYI